ncbi:MAG: hypothetical protein EOM67_15215 [Spirochaetia bacterium]|nr:hypothetical protein [Spirochaetia bacterium]
MAIERSKKVEAYRTAYEELPQEERLILSEQEYFLNLCETKERTNRLSHEGLVIQIDNDKRVYDSYEPVFRRNSHVDWKIMFDPADKTKVMAVNGDGSLRFLLEEKYIQPMALRDRKEGDAEELARLNQFNDGLKQNALDVAVEDYSTLANVRKMLSESGSSGMIEDRENEVYSKLMITDSLGQHKDRKNGVADKGKKLLAKQIEKERRKDLKTQEEEYLEYMKGKVDVNSYLIEE